MIVDMAYTYNYLFVFFKVVFIAWTILHSFYALKKAIEISTSHHLCAKLKQFVCNKFNLFFSLVRKLMQAKLQIVYWPRIQSLCNFNFTFVLVLKVF